MRIILKSSQGMQTKEIASFLGAMLKRFIIGEYWDLSR
jgi:hypothetical protein